MLEKPLGLGVRVRVRVRVRSCSSEATCMVTAMKAACCSLSPSQLHRLGV